ncbi:MAG TPA: hypothetical protein VJ965_01505, partial [Anaerolineales bacterium]|nr:hypothetical protein [Anaerolineales bacterium]
MDYITQKVRLWDEEHEIQIPNLPANAIPPGGFRGDMMAYFNAFLGQYPLKTMTECARDRREHRDHWGKWAEAHYTWNHFLREAPHLGMREAHHLATILLSRDLLAEAQGGLLGQTGEAAYMSRLGVPSLPMYFTLLVNTAARYAWWNRFRNHGVPDPKVDPMPPVIQSSRAKVDEIYRQRIQPWIDHYLTSKGYSRELEVLSGLILYVMGYAAEKPPWVEIAQDHWEAALRGFLSPPHAPFLWMLAYPGEYLNRIAEEGNEGRRSGFFSTPTNVVTMMAAMIGTPSNQGDTTRGHYVLKAGLFECAVPGDTPEER